MFCARSFVLHIIVHCLVVVTTANQQKTVIRYLVPGDTVPSPAPGLNIYCHKANAKTLLHIWKSLVLNLNAHSDTFDLYEGKSPEEVEAKHEENQRSWSFNIFGVKRSTEFKINPFQDSCLGVFSLSDCQYTIVMSQMKIDLVKVTMLLVGILLFWFGHKLSHNSLFYYICGVTLGVTLSIIVLLYFIGKLLPKGKFMYVMMFTGWGASIYVAQKLWDNAQVIAMQYREYVAYYILITSMISFMICYRFGPVTNARTKRIIQWFLQGMGLLSVYFSSYFWQASLFMCALLVIFYNFQPFMFVQGRQYWKTIFPLKRRLLTDSEFRKEGRRETRKALQDLQGYCSSPECDPWKVVLRLKDPVRFAKFMQGEPHLLDKESDEHDEELTKLSDDVFTDDEESDY